MKLATKRRKHRRPIETGLVPKEPTARAAQTALKALAKRHRCLSTQPDVLLEQIRDLARATNPHLRSLRGAARTPPPGC
jgi:hypothetical protein